jgi:putative membrane protein
MFGKRITLAASASLVGATFLFAQNPPRPLEQGSTLPNQQQGTPSAAPTVPGAPAAAPTAPPAPGGQVIPLAPGQTPPSSRDIPTAPGQPVPGQPVPGQPVPGQPVQGQPVQGQPVQGTPTQVQPGTPQQQQPRSLDNQRAAEQANQAMPDDAKFLVKAAEIDLAEINIGRLAALRASRPEVRQFGNKLVQEHSTNLAQVNQLANRNNWRSGERMDQEHQQLFQKLATMQGQAFDQEFLQKMAAGHKKAAEVFQHASEHCQNADIKQFATQTLAAVRQHEQEAQRLMGQNQGQATQPTSTDNNNNNANRTDGNRNNTTPNDNQNRRDDR